MKLDSAAIGEHRCRSRRLSACCPSAAGTLAALMPVHSKASDPHQKLR
jgi:hypothetical protein